MEKQPCVYLLAAGSHSTFYTGVTSNLAGRIWQHRTGAIKGFTARYDIKRLVWFELHETMHAAITREKQIKRWARAWKYDLVNGLNPTWRDLAEDFGSILCRSEGRQTPGQARGDECVRYPPIANVWEPDVFGRRYGCFGWKADVSC